ncbi:MAG: MmcQ/YjbR family DNA-binding protein [Chitinophagaceae bacterium]|nr:MmcQ/YjbR family DNA-binding protein [Chitinophagaceae bacterium]
MVSIANFRKLCLAFDEALEQPHFEKTSFRVRKKIFATLDEKTGKAVVKLSATDQSVFCAFDKAIIYPVPGGWGRQGWTIVELKKITTAMLKDILTVSYCNVAPKGLAGKYQQL